MKKTISIILILSLTLSMVMAMNINTFAAKTDIMDISGFEPGNSTIITKNVAGSMGKEATDTVWRLEKAASYARMYDDMTFGAAVEQDGTINYKYSVLQVNVKPAKENMKMQFRDETGRNYIAMPITAGNISANKWNSVIMYIDYTNINADNYLTEFPKATIYINGKKYNDYTQTALTSRIGLYAAVNGSNLKSRLYFHFENNTSGGGFDDVEVEVADLRWYTSDTLPDGASLTAVPSILGNGSKFTVSNNQITVTGDTLTVKDIKNENSGKNITAYTDSKGTKKLNDTDTLYTGDIVAVEKDLCYSYYSISGSGAVEAEKSIIEGKTNGFTAGDGSTAALAYGTAGKDSADKVLNISKSSAGGRIVGGGLSSVAKDGTVEYDYYVLKFNYLPRCDRGIALRTAGNEAVAMPASAAEFNKNQWNSVLIYVDYSKLEKDYIYSVTSNSDENVQKAFPVGHIFINGEEYDSGLMVSNASNRFGMYTSSAATSANVDFRLEFTGSDELDVDIDDLYIYRTNTLPTAAETDIEPLKSSLITVNNNVAKIKNDTTLAKLSNTYPRYTFKAYRNGDLTGEVTDAELNLADGWTLVTIDRKGVINYSTIVNYVLDDISIFGDNYDSSNHRFISSGNATFSADVSDGGMLLVAQYNEEGKLDNVLLDNTGSDGSLSVTFPVKGGLGESKVKAFLWKDALNPICLNKVIPMKSDETNILFIGNSFSRDVSWYIKDIAKADNLTYNIGLLNWGSRTIGDHYDNREVPLSESKIYFSYNNVSLKNDIDTYYWNLKTVLEDYSWDYIVMQNWGPNVDFYANTDENYNANWSKMADMAAYLHGREPKAEILIHETWAFETGYKEFITDEIREQITTNIQALNSRCATACADAIGLNEPLRVITSGSAFDAARKYENGAYFDTTYYSDGHKFEAGTTVNVGDGSDMLHPDDKEAGKTSLHRDGFHAGPAGEYLIALNAYKIISGKNTTDIENNTFDNVVSTRLGSASAGVGTDVVIGEGQTVYQTYDKLSAEIISKLKSIVVGMYN